MEIIKVEIPQHIRKVQLSAKQRPYYYEWDGKTIKGKRKKVPSSYFIDKSKSLKEVVLIEDLKDNYCIGVFNNANKLITTIKHSSDYPVSKQVNYKHRLCIKIDDNIFPVLCNPKIANTPKLYLIKGQDFYNSKIREFQRGVIMDEIKKCYTPFVESMPVISDYPVKIECEIHDTIKNYYDGDRHGLGLPWDIDNYAYPYMKAFPDLLQKLGKLRNDDRLHVTQPPTPIFCPIEKHEDRKLVFIISKDERDVIVNNKIYQSYHKNPETFETEDLDLVKDDDEPFSDGFGVTVDSTEEQKTKVKEVVKIFGTGGGFTSEELAHFEKIFKNPENDEEK